MSAATVLASVDAGRVFQGVLGGVLLLGSGAVAATQLLRWQRRRRAAAKQPPRTPALARFVDGETTDPSTFGGGAWSARVKRRRDSVTYGYLAVAEEYESADSGGRWCTLTVTLPGCAPFVVVDNRAANGRTGVPMDAPHRSVLDDPPFDATYVAGGDDADVLERVLGEEARDVLMRSPVQRMMLRDTRMLLRTFDGVALDAELIDWLNGIAARFLASTPSFVTPARETPVAAARGEISDAPLPEGFYGLD